jgi:hypothetical protein
MPVLDHVDRLSRYAKPFRQIGLGPVSFRA